MNLFYCSLVSATFDVGRDDGLGSRRNLLEVTPYEDLCVIQLVFYLRFPLVPRTMGSEYSRTLGTGLNPPRMSGGAPDQA